MGNFDCISHGCHLLGSEYFTATKDDGGAKKKDLPKVIISTEVNGRTIAQRTEKVPVPPVVVLSSPPPLVGDTKFFQEDEEYDLEEEDEECARLLNASDGACKSRRKQSVPGDNVDKVIKDQNRDIMLGGGAGDDLLL